MESSEANGEVKNKESQRDGLFVEKCLTKWLAPSERPVKMSLQNNLYDTMLVQDKFKLKKSNNKFQMIKGWIWICSASLFLCVKSYPEHDYGIKRLLRFLINLVILESSNPVQTFCELCVFDFLRPLRETYLVESL